MDVSALRRDAVMPSASQRADVCFDPDGDPERTKRRRALGLLGRITETLCLLEHFHQAPSLARVKGCLRKTLNLPHDHPSRRPEGVQVEVMGWMFCAGRPDDALATMKALRLTDWPAGVYELPGLPLRFVVLAELPETDDTLAMRQLGERFGLVAEGLALLKLMNDAIVATRPEAAAMENPMVKTPYSDAIENRGIAKGRASRGADGPRDRHRRARPRDDRRLRRRRGARPLGHSRCHGHVARGGLGRGRTLYPLPHRNAVGTDTRWSIASSTLAQRDPRSPRARSIRNCAWCHATTYRYGGRAIPRANAAP